MPTHITKDLHLYLRLLHYATPYWRVFAIAIISMLVLAATDPAIPALMKEMVDKALIDNDPQAIRQLPLLLILLFAVRGLSSYLSGGALAWVATRVVMDLQRQMFAKLMQLPAAFFAQQPTGAILSRFTFDVNRIQEAVSYAVTILVRDAVSILGLTIWLLYIDWQLTLLALLSAPLIAIANTIIKRRLRRMSRLVQDSVASLHNILEDAIANHKIVKIYNGYADEQRQFEQLANKFRNYQYKFSLTAAAASPSVQLIMAVVISLIIMLVTQPANLQTLSVGDFISFFTAIAILMAPIKRIVALNEHIQKGLAACENVFAIIDSEPQKDNGSIILNDIRHIHFEHVTFFYPGSEKASLSELNLQINAGETIALVGLSGGGKSTLANLLPRFYEPSTGCITINGKDISEFSLTSLRQKIAYVSQEIMLFDDTIKNNIAFGELARYSTAEITAAAKAAHVMEFVALLPDGLDTLIGENGMRLSGGQRQRLAIARAFLKDAMIVILDEATSSLDNTTEQGIQKALYALQKNRTCLTIAHRMSTIQNADRIVVIEHGRVVEEGTHKALLEQQGSYARLYQSGQQ